MPEQNHWLGYSHLTDASMKFTITSDFTCKGYKFRKGEKIELYPTKSQRLILKKQSGVVLEIGPIIFNYLYEVEIPTAEQLSKWLHSSTCESPTGHIVYIDEVGPDGFHSWFKYLNYL
jgi:hypothetical protein